MKFLLLVYCIFLNYYIFGQDYEFKVQNADYELIDTIKSKTVIESVLWSQDEDSEFSYIPIGFDFKIGEEIFDSIYVNIDGQIVFYQKCGIDFQVPTLFALLGGYSDRAFLTATGIPVSKIHYTTQGENGSRIFKLEWNNVGFYGSDGGYFDYVNFQVWLYESGIIEIHYGSSNIAVQNDADAWFYFHNPFVAWGYGLNCIEDDLGLTTIVTTGNPENPDVNIVNSETFLELNKVVIDGVPQEGTVYQFKPTIVGIKDNKQNELISLHSDMNSEFLIINKSTNSEYTLVIYNLQGEIIRKQLVKEKQIEIDIKGLYSGFYLAKVGNNEFNKTFKFIKK